MRAEHMRSEALKDFKSLYCDENRLIADALSTELRPYIHAPVLDVGAGLGDIAAIAFPDMPAVLLDQQEFLPSRILVHQRVVGDFFDYVPQSSLTPQTILLSHVLQYLDSDLEALRTKIHQLSPATVITVLNDNDGHFGAIMNWALTAIESANPEVDVPFLDSAQYVAAKSIPIRATLRCPTFDVMAYHFVDVLLDAPVNNVSIMATRAKLESLLTDPVIIINQTISCHVSTKSP